MKKQLVLVCLMFVGCAYSMDTKPPVSKSIIPFVKQPTALEMLRLWRRERICLVEFELLSRKYKAEFISDCNDIELPAYVRNQVRIIKRKLLEESGIPLLLLPGKNYLEALLQFDSIINGNIYN